MRVKSLVDPYKKSVVIWGMRQILMSYNNIYSQTHIRIHKHTRTYIYISCCVASMDFSDSLVIRQSLPEGLLDYIL